MVGTRGEIRTHAGAILSRLPLPLGYSGSLGLTSTSIDVDCQV
jgi:hypothetical protein